VGKDITKIFLDEDPDEEEGESLIAVAVAQIQSLETPDEARPSTVPAHVEIHEQQALAGFRHWPQRAVTPSP
jgi:hypothetical protein